ncbi:MAG: hybrid sensor histidine kinase/response regulator [Bdellovibrionales bacterium]|nr:hybrid sensor histidine kinase/response regulator [Bdellovibrionales bacterium]
MAKHTILCVDDELDNVDALERLFRKNYTVLKATSGAQGLEVLAENPGVALIISDQRMPSMTGVEFLEKAQRTHPEALRILLTGYTDIESVIQAVNQGQIYRYLTKPWDSNDLLNTVATAIQKYEMTKELKKKNFELAKALNELKSLDKAKSNFMILINHELKTPLTSIISFIGLLNETQMDDEQKLFVNRISRGADKLKSIIDDVLLIVRAETHQLKVNTSPVSFAGIQTLLNPEVSNVLQYKHQTLTEKNLAVTAAADKDLIRQVLNRLVHNAAKFGSDNSEIFIEAAAAENQQVVFSVTNKGPQIEAPMIEKILRPFFIDEDVMNHSTGMGLGLSICQSILGLHQSKLRIENTDEGVRVSFNLPSA